VTAGGPSRRWIRTASAGRLSSSRRGREGRAAAPGAERLDALAGETGARPLVLDATRRADVEACLSAALDQLGGLDGVANCAGSLLLKPAHLERGSARVDAHEEEASMEDEAGATRLGWCPRFATAELMEKARRFAGSANEENLDRLEAGLRPG